MGGKKNNPKNNTVELHLQLCMFRARNLIVLIVGISKCFHLVLLNNICPGFKSQKNHSGRTEMGQAKLFK